MLLGLIVMDDGVLGVKMTWMVYWEVRVDGSELAGWILRMGDMSLGSVEQKGRLLDSPIAFHPLTLTTHWITLPSLCNLAALMCSSGASLMSEFRATVKTSIKGGTISCKDGSSSPGKGR